MAREGVQAENRFRDYVDRLAEALGHADRQEPLRAYLTGLLLSGERKSIEPMAAKIDPLHVRARHQSMHHFVANAPWEEQEVMRGARDYALSQLERHGPVGAWVVDDTGIPKKGTHSVGVARQYCAPLGKQDNCQVAVTLSLVNATMSVPSAYCLYLPEIWARDRKRRKAAGIPPEVRFRTKWEIALEQIDALLKEELPRAPVVADAGYGVVTEFREAITARQLSYAMGISREITVWPPGIEPLPAKRWHGIGRPPSRLRRSRNHRPLAVEVLARKLAPSAWQTVSWREGTRGMMRSRFALLRVRVAHRDEQRSRPRDPEWLLIEWPVGQAEPAKYWLSTVPHTVTLEELVRLVKIRWRIERDFEELKDELGLDHYEGRSWKGFHHHGALSIAAYCFLAAERARLSPPQPLAFLRPARLPKGFRPRGAAPASGATQSGFYHHHAHPSGSLPSLRTALLSLVRRSKPTIFMTQ
jgi:SRSO17 transposase